MKLIRLVAAIGAAIIASSLQAQTVITDGDFTNFSFGSHGTGVATATVVREAAGGNPGARLNITTITTFTDVAFGTAIKNDFSTNVPLAGTSFTLSLDVLSGAGGFGQGQAIELLVEQNGTVYATPLGITGFPRNFDTVTFIGVFNAASFTRVIGAGPLTPAFNGSVTTRFGFAGGNLNSLTLTQYYDNFRLVIAAVAAPPLPTAPIPTLSTWGTIILAGLMAFVAFVALGRMV